jgi:hypothetical protein
METTERTFCYTQTTEDKVTSRILYHGLAVKWNTGHKTEISGLAAKNQTLPTSVFLTRKLSRSTMCHAGSAHAVRMLVAFSRERKTTDT